MPQSHFRAACFGAGLVAAVLACPDPAVAASQRTFVSTAGVDNPTCSLAAPCRSFGFAVTAALAGGEVIVLDSGGYGPVSIAKSITITAPKGVYAGISVFSGVGVDVGLVAPSDVVTLRGLTINGLGGAHGIAFTGTGTLRVFDSVATGFTGGGLTFTPTGTSSLRIEGSGFDRNGLWGIRIAGGGSGGFETSVVIDRTSLNDNAYGIQLYENLIVTIRDSMIARNSNTGVIFDQLLSGTFTHVDMIRTTMTQNFVKNVWAGDPSSGNGSSGLLLRDCVLDRSGIGLRAGDRSSTYLTNSTINANTTGIEYGTTAVFVQSQGNNFVAGNGTNGTAGITVLGSN